MHTLPLLIEADQLQALLGSEGLLVVDLCKPDTYAKGHIPGAVHLDYAQIVAQQPPVMGLLPSAETLGNILSLIGLTPETQVVAYDDEGGGRAARLLWTLDALGHPHSALLNGGLHAWANENHPLEVHQNHVAQSSYLAQFNDKVVARKAEILAGLDDPAVALWDSRSPEEYTGTKKFAQRGGHIPGAINMDWFNVMDQTRNLRLKPEAELRALLDARGLTPDKTVITYCQTHHRSALTYFVLKLLGYPKAKGYPGSWSEWGNAEDTPIEQPAA